MSVKDIDYGVPLVKFCGMCRVEDVDAAVELGVDFIGVILVPGTPREISLEQAVKLRARLPSNVRFVTVVRNPSVEFVQTIIEKVSPDFIQFHGNETADFCRQFNHPFWKVIAVKNKKDVAKMCSDFQRADGVVFDAWSADGGGGAGVTFDWEMLPEIRPEDRRLTVLAGGLNPENVADFKEVFINKKMQAVDVSSGIEETGQSQKKGIKSVERMSLFMKNIKN